MKETIIALIVGYLVLCWTAEFGFVIGSLWVFIALNSLSSYWWGWITWELPRILRTLSIVGLVLLVILWLTFEYEPPLWIIFGVVSGSIGMVLYKIEDDPGIEG